MVDLNSNPINGMSDQSLDSGADIQRPRVDGQQYPKIGFVNSIDSMVRLESFEIESLLTAIGADPLVGYPIDTADNVTLYCQLAESLGSRSATGALKAVVNRGIVVPMSLNVGVEQPGSIQFEVYAISDGTNAPLVTTPNQSLVGTPAIDQVFWAGPVKLNNTLVEGIQSISITFGIAVRKEKDGGTGAGAVYFTEAYIDVSQPIITVVSNDVDLFDTYKEGVDIASSTLVQLAKGIKGGSRAAGTVHPQITVAQGMICAKTSTGDPQQVSIEIHPTKDSSNSMLAYVLADLL
jgi:hypothetical protein